LGQDQARNLLDRVGVLQHPCDLDLLLFFARHPRTLTSSEQLGALTGYGSQQTADSLDRLLRAELVTRTQNRTRSARLYVFAAGTNDGMLPPLLEFASTRLGRLAMRQALARPPGGRTEGFTAPDEGEAAEGNGRLPSRVKGRAKVTGEPPKDERRRSGR
jgi:hypothetical protein